MPQRRRATALEVASRAGSNRAHPVVARSAKTTIRELVSRYGLDVLISSAVVVLLASPLLFTRNGFETDFTNNLWLVWAQGASISSGHHPIPSYFFHSTTQGIFNPMYVFYGGTFFVIPGVLSALLGGRAVVAFVGMMIVGVIAAYGGMLWLGRQCGLRGPRAHVPAIVVLTSAFYVTQLYGRADSPEFMALSMLPMVVASGAHLLRSARWTVIPVITFLVSTVLFSGSHNITLLWGTTVGVFVALVLWLVLRPSLPPLRRFGAVAVLTALAVMINGYFLIPEALYVSKVAASATQAGITLGASNFFDTPGVLFDPLRHVPSASTTPALFVQAPVWFLLWSLAAGAALFVARRGDAARLWRAWLAIAFVLAGVFGLIMSSWPWEHLPAPFVYIQFPFRLDGFVALLSAGLVLVGALALGQRIGDRRALFLRVGLGVAVMISVALCVWQLWVPNVRGPGSYVDRREALISVHVLPRSWYDPESFIDRSQPLITVPAGRKLVIEPGLVRADAVSATLPVPTGPQPIETNIAAGPYFVSITGLRRLGRSAAGFTVVAREPQDTGPRAPSAIPVRVHVTDSAALILARLCSIVGILGALVALIYVGVRQHRSDSSQSGRDAHVRTIPSDSPDS